MYNQCAKLYDTPLRDQFSRQCFRLSTKVFSGRAIAPPDRILDLGCGTGLLCRLLSDSGFSVVGVDISESMMEIAQERCAEAGSGPEFVLQDIRTFRRPGEFKAALCFGDVLNHLLEPADLSELFSSVWESLAPGGVFLADTTTLEAYRSELWRARGLTEQRDGLNVSLSSDFDAELGLGWIEINAQTEGVSVSERMEQRYHQEQQVEALLKQAGFQQVYRQGFDPLPELADYGTIKQCWLALK